MYFLRAGWDFVKEIALLTIRIAFSFTVPLTINRVLAYIETRGEGAIVRPWVWVLALFVAPVASSIAWQSYGYQTQSMVVRTEAIITQLIFEHALKIRLKDETAMGGDASRMTTAAATPHTESLAPDEIFGGDDADHMVESSEATVVSESETSTRGKGVATAPAKGSPTDASTKKEAKPTTSGSNPIGNMTNLVSTDLSNITDGNSKSPSHTDLHATDYCIPRTPARDTLFLFYWAPLQISVAVYFLYRLFGWAAYVGLAAMVITFPIPGQ